MFQINILVWASFWLHYVIGPQGGFQRGGQGPQKPIVKLETKWPPVGQCVQKEPNGPTSVQLVPFVVKLTLRI